jgi:multiple sugar transport system permease protein
MNGLSPKQSLNRILLYILLILLLFVYLFPLLWQLSTSLKDASEVFSGYNLIPQKITGEAYFLAWSRFNVRQYLFNTSIVAVVVLLGTLVSCGLAGYAFGQLRFPGKNMLFYFYLATMMVPGAVTLIPSYYVILKLNWANTYYGLIGPFFLGNAFGTFLMRQFFMTLPKELSESATIDGAGYFQTWWRIMLPLSKPALATLGVMTLVSQWNNFLWPLVITQSQSLKVLSVGLSDFRIYFTIQWNTLMAAVIIAIVPMLIILILAQKMFIQGIQFSGVNR